MDPTSDHTDTPPTSQRSGIFRPKGNLSKSELAVLLALAVIPLLVILVRITALPGVMSPDLSGPLVDLIRAVGSSLNDTLSLNAVPPDVRGRVLYLLFLPTCAALIALARLTFGIRVLGFRSILIAVGFHESGVVPSLILIALVVGTIGLLRPRLRRIRLPKYARLSVILCVVAVTMLGALVIGPWLRSEVIWRVAFFPVIVLGLLAEGFARTLDRDNMATASWRVATTVVIAFLISLLFQVPALREMLLQFPELVVSQIVAVILISEYLDLRLLQDMDSKLSGMALPKLFALQEGYRVAVVRNRETTGIIGPLGRPTPEKHARRSVQPIVDALRGAGHTVRVIEGDRSLLSELRDFMPPHPRNGQPGGIVFNLSHGIQGHLPSAHVPAMLEMAGVPYTGAGPLGLTVTSDKLMTKKLLQQAGVCTPACRLLASPGDDTHELRYPLIVKPRQETTYKLQIVQDRRQLKKAVTHVLRRYQQQALVEECIDGREINVAVLGNAVLECLPLVELDRATREKVCPAPVHPSLARQIRDAARAAFWACECRDYARINFRIDETDQLYVIEIDTFGVLERNGSFARAAIEAGSSFDELVCRIVEIARARYLGGETVRPAGPAAQRLALADPLLQRE